MDEEEEEFSEEEIAEMTANLKEKKKTMEAALKEYLELRAEYLGFPNAYTTSYAISSEFITVPEDQPPSVTRGLFEFGADSYSRQSIRVRVETSED